MSLVGFGLPLDAQDPYFTFEPIQGRRGHDGRLIDLGGDGAPDAIVTDLAWPPAPSPVRGLSNDGNGGFRESSEALGVGSLMTDHSRHFAVADFNGDGRQDFFIADHGLDVPPFPGGQSRLLIQDAAGRLVDETATRLPIQPAFTHHLSAGDIDRDGDLDVYMCNIHGQGQVGPRFYMNDGSGRFTADTSRIPAVLTSLEIKYESSQLIDLDDDGDPDLVLGGHENTANPRDAILVNDGTGRFTFATPSVMPLRLGDGSWGTAAISTADFDRNGTADLLMVTHGNYLEARLQLLLRGAAGFVDATVGIPQAWPVFPGQMAWIKWALPADFNNDGLMDFVTTGGAGNIPPHLFLNIGGGVFEDHSEILPVRPVAATAVIPGDLDRDGDVDLFGINGDADAYWILRNLRPFQVTPRPCSTDPPTDVRYVTNGSLVTLTWQGPSPSPDSYVLTAGSRSGVRDLLTLDLGTNRTTLTAVAPPGTYYVDLRARFRCGTSAPTSELVVRVP